MRIRSKEVGKGGEGKREERAEGTPVFTRGAVVFSSFIYRRLYEGYQNLIKILNLGDVSSLFFPLFFFFFFFVKFILVALNER